MKAKPGFYLREICGQNIIVAEGEQNIDFSQLIVMNESASLLWRELEPRPAFTLDDMVKVLTDNYDVDRDTALADSTVVAASWGRTGIIEGDDIPQADVPDMAIPDTTPTAAPASQPKQKKSLLKRLFRR